jgi:hypothetical protein
MVSRGWCVPGSVNQYLALGRGRAGARFGLALMVMVLDLALKRP